MHVSRALRVAAVAAMLALPACTEEPTLRSGLVTPAEVQAFYAAHPSLFEGRRVYSVRRMRIQGHAFETVDATLAAEDVPLALLPRLAEMQPGDAALVKSSDGAVVWQLLAYRDAPLSINEASGPIQDFLEKLPFGEST